MPSYLASITVNNIMILGEQHWDFDLLHDICVARDVELIKRIPLPMVSKSDS